MSKTLLCLAALALPLSAWADPQIAAPAGAEPLSDFARQMSYTDVQLSPTGKYVSAKVYDGDQAALIIMRTSDKKVTSRLRFSQDQSIAEYWWAGPERMVASLGAPTSGGRDANVAPLLTGELIGLNADGGDTQYLFGYRETVQTGSRLTSSNGVRGWASVIDPLPDDPHGALIKVEYFVDNESSYLRGGVVETGNGKAVVFKMDKENGKRDEVTTSPYAGSSDFLTDHSGQVRYVSGWDANRQWQVWYRAKGASEWRKQKIDGTPWAFSSDDSKVYLKASEDGQSCLIELAPDSGERRKLACDVNGLESLVYSFDGSHPIAAVFYGITPDVRILDPKDPDAALYSELMNAFAHQLVQVIPHGTGGTTALLLVRGDRNPGDFYTFEPATKKAQYLFSRGDWIDPDTQAEVRPYTFKARDGKVLGAYLTVPHGRDAHNLPLVAVPYGTRYDGRDAWEWQAQNQMLASRGYAVLQVNGRDEHRGLHLTEDLTDGVKWAVAQGYADPQRLCIFGKGYGGYQAMMSAVLEPDLYRCVIGYAGFYDLKSMPKDSQHKEALTLVNDMLGAEGADDQRLLELSPVNQLDKLKAAVMLAHGDQDTISPYSQAKDLRAALEARQHPVDWLVKKGEWHGFYEAADREELYARLLVFLEKNIGPGAPPKAGATQTAAETPAGKS